MNRLSIEFRRLFLSAETAPTDSADRLRALVLELARPANWQQLAAVWKGVQADLQLPAPAIAVNGIDGLQLWFSVAEPMENHRAQAFLDALRQRYLADVPRHRITLMPSSGSPGPEAVAVPHATSVPAAQGNSGHWSAFVAPDLAPLFDETPWLDIPPGDDAQAGLLSKLESIKPSQLDAALRQLQAVSATPADTTATGVTVGGPRTTDPPAACDPEARHFLLAVMNDTAAPLALRIEAAKSLLPYGQGV